MNVFSPFGELILKVIWRQILDINKQFIDTYLVFSRNFKVHLDPIQDFISILWLKSYSMNFCVSVGFFRVKFIKINFTLSMFFIIFVQDYCGNIFIGVYHSLDSGIF